VSKCEFWKDWKKKTKLEKSAIESLKIAKKIILSEIPKEKIVAIYVKGSFVRREMDEKSDVDTAIILKESKLHNKELGYETYWGYRSVFRL
jgi:predicted nucleotidyltransferase